MTLVVETGVGVRGANSYVNADYVTTYLTARNRVTENSWSTAGSAAQKAACIGATDYVEKRFAHRYPGVPLKSFDAEYAEGSIVFSGLPVAAETLTLGDQTYTFVSSLTGEADEILIGASATATADNLSAAINGGDGAGTLYGTGTSASRHATSASATGTLTLTALAPGVSGALTELSGSPTNVTLNAFTGGRDGGIQPLGFPRNYAYDRHGVAILGIPDRLKQAVAEYAVRAVSSALLPDPTSDARGGILKAISEKIGPIEESSEYFGFAAFTPYPAADKLMAPLLVNRGGVIRG